MRKWKRRLATLRRSECQQSMAWGKLYIPTPSTQLTIFYLKYRTFAYKTVTERMPRILAQVVDALNKLEASIRERHGDVSVIPFSPWPISISCVIDIGCRLEWRS